MALNSLIILIICSLALAPVAEIKIPPTTKDIVFPTVFIVNLCWSEFLPPFKVSFPELPYIVSEPKPPFIVLLLPFPVNLSSPYPP